MEHIRKSFLIHDGNVTRGYDNEDVCDLVDQAIAYGVSTNGGKREALSIAFATMWVDGWCAAAEVDADEAKFLHNAVSNYFFI